MQDDVNMLMEVGPEKPHEKRAARACKLAAACAELASSSVGAACRHVGFVLLQCCVACALDFDLRVCIFAELVTSLHTVNTALKDALTAVTATDISEGDLFHTSCRADLN